MTQNNLGNAFLRLAQVGDREANLRRAVAAYEQALVVYTPETAPFEYATTQNNLGTAYSDLESADDAAASYSEAIAVARRVGARDTEARASWNLGLLFEESDPARAADLMEVCVDYEVETGNPGAEEDTERVQRLRERIAPEPAVAANPGDSRQGAGGRRRDSVQPTDDHLAFWTELLARMKQKTPLFGSVSPQPQNWIVTGAGRTGVAYMFFVRAHDSQVSLRIRCEKEADSKAIFDALHSKKKAIERQFGQALEWQRLEGQSTSRIDYVLTGGGLRDRERWPEIQDRMIDAMVRLEKALSPHIKAP